MTKLREKWKDVLALLEPEITEIAYETWFEPIVIKNVDETEKIINLTIDNELALSLINDRYRTVFTNVIKRVYGEGYNFSIKYEVKEKPIPNNQEEKPGLIGEFYLNPRYNFKNFIVGKNNEFAHAAAVAVAESPSKAYNPLFLYGGSGLGKTHLMHAIGHHILKNNDDVKVLYVSSETFVNDMVKALRKNELRNENNMSEFRTKYREIDVLLIDDIQFLEGKDAIQEEFFNTFNTLYSLNKQIIISSDRSPTQLTKMDERLRSRFQWNLVADISAPEFQTRAAILLNNAENEGIDITDDVKDVINIISEKIQENVRELEGAFTRIISFAKLMNKEINLSFAKEVLKDIFSGADFNINAETIKKKVSKHFNIKVADMESSNRSRQFAFPRQIAMYLCRELTDLSLPKIGEAFGGRDHSTVLHAYEKISKEVSTNESLKDVVDNLKKDIQG
ncbi:MAG: chromosomal replication initiator protein DnaA [Clostridiales bacterium]|nr:chromosomal replication initiator protein DnaA [Clostridiales bacterium]